MKQSNNVWWVLGLAGALGAVAPGHAQEQVQETTAPDEIVSAEEIVVLGQIAYRDRSEVTAPVLEYGLDYFQRFEPLTAGDALKRVPGVAFVGTDILESDQAQLRGLGSGYTQILINGEQVPGSGDDRSFFVDRIPAELIERVEIIRSPSASRSGDAVAGALNIVLRDSFALNGGFVRGGAILFPDDEIGVVLGGVYGGQVGPGRLLVGANMQDRRNPKEKLSLRYAPNDNDDGFEFDNREVQTDLRDGTDYSFNANYIVDVFGGELDLTGFYVRTDRITDEDSIEYESLSGFDDLITVNANDTDVDQENYSLTGRFKADAFGGQFKAKLSYSKFKDDIFEDEFEVAFDGDESEVEGDAEQTDRTDTELSAKLAQEFNFSNDLKVEFGVDYKKKERESSILEDGTDEEFDDADISTAAEAFALLRPLRPDTPVAGGISTIEETRIDPYVQINGEEFGGKLDWELGFRLETTDTDVSIAASAIAPDEDVAEFIEETGLVLPSSGSTSYEEFLPSFHVKYNLTNDDRVSVSVARTVNRPRFNYLNPALLEGELGDNDFVGNPNLEPETAVGLDIGYERRLPGRGVVGVNYFHRSVSNLIEIYSTGAESFAKWDDDDDGFVFSARNTGDATINGVEFDIASPLSFIGLDNTGVFANYAWLDSEVADEVGKRRINSQAEFVFNAGFIHDIPSWGASFGASYRDQGDAVDRVVGEEVLISYGPNLEMFVEKRFGKRFTVRLTGSNLLDETKDERFYKFDNLEDQLDGARGDIGAFDELEYETEQAGRVWQLIGRMAF